MNMLTLILCLASYHMREKSLVKHVFNFAFMWQDLAVAIQITEWCHVTGRFEKKCDSDLKEPDCLSFEEEIRLSVLEASARWKAQLCIHKLLCKHEKGYHASVTTVMNVQWEP